MLHGSIRWDLTEQKNAVPQRAFGRVASRIERSRRSVLRGASGHQNNRSSELSRPRSAS